MGSEGERDRMTRMSMKRMRRKHEEDEEVEEEEEGKGCTRQPLLRLEQLWLKREPMVMVLMVTYTI